MCEDLLHILPCSQTHSSSVNFNYPQRNFLGFLHLSQNNNGKLHVNFILLFSYIMPDNGSANTSRISSLIEVLLLRIFKHHSVGIKLPPKQPSVPLIDTRFVRFLQQLLCEGGFCHPVPEWANSAHAREAPLPSGLLWELFLFRQSPSMAQSLQPPLAPEANQGQEPFHSQGWWGNICRWKALRP